MHGNNKYNKDAETELHAGIQRNRLSGRGSSLLSGVEKDPNELKPQKQYMPPAEYNMGTD